MEQQEGEPVKKEEKQLEPEEATPCWPEPKRLEMKKEQKNHTEEARGGETTAGGPGGAEEKERGEEGSGDGDG